MARIGVGVRSDLHVECIGASAKNAYLARLRDTGAGSLGHYRRDAEARDEQDHQRAIVSLVLLGDGCALGCRVGRHSRALAGWLWSAPSRAGL